MGVGLFLFRNLATSFMFGARWSEASDIVGAWALASPYFILFEGFNGEAYKAKGMPKILFVFQMVFIVVMVPICIAAKNVGFWPMVYTRSATIGIEVIIGMFFMKKYIGFSFSKMISNIVPAVVASIAMFIFGYYIKMLSVSVIWQIASIIVCIGVYGSVLLALFSQQVKHDVKVFKTNWHIK